MSVTVFYIIEILLSIIGIWLILIQRHPEEGSSFFASSIDVFKFQSLKDKILFIATIVTILLFVLVLYLHNVLV